MNSSTTQDVSLYELARSSEQPSQTLQVSPATLKSMIDALMDVLIDQKIPATLWAKLPRGETWPTEIERYRQLAGTCQAVYLCSHHKDDFSEEADGSLSQMQGSTLPSVLQSQAASDGEFSALGNSEALLPTTPEYAPLYSIQLAPESQLRREYFLLVLSQQFSGLILAHRPRSVQTAKSGQSSESDLERKQPLLALCSFKESTLQRVLEGIQQAVSLGHTEAIAANPPVPAPRATDPNTATLSTTSQLVSGDLLEHWSTLFGQFNLRSPDLGLLDYFVNKQVQRQEEIWRRATNYRKQAETAEALQLQNVELVNALRLKDEFLNNLGQEMRTPLTNMKTALTLLNSPNLKPAQRQRYMQLLHTECDHQGSLISGLLELVQLDQLTTDQGTMQPLRLTDIVPGVVSTYQPLAQEKGIMLAYTIPEELPAISCLSPWLKQIVINLLHNGVKFTPQGGQVWVRAKQQGDYVQLEFRDSGIGIPTTEIPRIFDRFYRVRHPGSDDYGGAGLGLTIVQQILFRCGGSISVKSKLGEGSTFNVLLPVYHAPTVNE